MTGRDETEAAGGRQLERTPDGRLVRVADGARTDVEPQAAFPWTAPGRHVSLRDADRNEVEFIDRVDRLDPASRAALEKALEERHFVLDVRLVRHAQPFFQLRLWKVDTPLGPRSFQTRIDQWLDPLPGGGYLLRDVAGDLYRFPPLERLDARSRRILEAFIE